MNFLRVIAITNQKGGCGKTTTSINFAASLAHLNKKVLLIDVDPQGHCGCGLGIDARKFSYSLYDLLRPSADFRPPLEDVMTVINPFLCVLPAATSLACLESDLANLIGREKRLKELVIQRLSPKYDFDYVLLDCPPNLGILTANALEAADDVVIPIEPSFFSLHGLAKMTELLQSLNTKRSYPVRIHALLTIFNSRTCFAKEVYDEVRLHFREKLFRTIIHDSVVLKEAASAGRSILDYDFDSMSAKDYLNLAREFLEREWNSITSEDESLKVESGRNSSGPCQVLGGVLFQYRCSDVHTVEVAGDFNQWNPEPLVRRRGDGLWQKIIPMPPDLRQCRYKLIVDGEWQVDPGQVRKSQNIFGSYDSCLELV